MSKTITMTASDLLILLANTSLSVYVLFTVRTGYSMPVSASNDPVTNALSSVSGDETFAVRMDAEWIYFYKD